MERDIKKYLHKRFNKSDSQVSPIRCKGFKRNDLIRLFAELGYENGVEIGVAEGLFSEYMCQTIPNIDLHSIDSWEAENIEDSRAVMMGKETAENRYEEAKKRLLGYNCKIVKSTSMEAIKLIPKDSLDFVYIDGNHTFDYVMQDIIEWSKRVKEGGIIAGHDYYHFRWSGIIEAVEIYTKMHRINEYFITDERTPSFFWGK